VRALRQLLRSSALAALAAGAAPAAGQAPDDAAPSDARALYVAACGSCHGTDGRGNPRIDAPVLAGLSAAYLERQIDGFRRGYRGRHPEDREGAEMRPMIVGFADADLAALAGWLASLPLPASSAAAADGTPADGAETTDGEAAPAGDPARGRTLYAACAVCHGRSGEGNDALGAPRLAGQAGWYTARQLRKFIDGVRGSDPDDTSGASMRASVADLGSRDVADVVAWIEVLREAGP
jgi:cytochrome c553